MPTCLQSLVCPSPVRAGLLLTLCALAASATTITFKSGDAWNEWNSTPTPLSANSLVTPNELWATDDLLGARWVSYTDTGRRATFLPNSVVTPIARFTERFDLPASAKPFTGFINVWADDTAAVYLNGTVLQPADFVIGEHCSAGPIGCVAGHSGRFDLILPGNQTYLLDIDVYQLGGDSSGVMYSGSFEAPEPATYVLLGMGLAAMGVVRLRRR